MPIKQPYAEFPACAGQASWADPATELHLPPVYSLVPTRRARLAQPVRLLWQARIGAAPCLKARRLNHEINAAGPA